MSTKSANSLVNLRIFVFVSSTSRCIVCWSVESPKKNLPLSLYIGPLVSYRLCELYKPHNTFTQSIVRFIRHSCSRQSEKYFALVSISTTLLNKLVLLKLAFQYLLSSLKNYVFMAVQC